MPFDLDTFKLSDDRIPKTPEGRFALGVKQMTGPATVIIRRTKPDNRHAKAGQTG